MAVSSSLISTRSSAVADKDGPALGCDFAFGHVEIRPNHKDLRINRSASLLDSKACTLAHQLARLVPMGSKTFEIVFITGLRIVVCFIVVVWRFPCIPTSLSWADLVNCLEQISLCTRFDALI